MLLGSKAARIKLSGLAASSASLVAIGKNIGVTMDPDLSFGAHISTVAKIASLHL